MRHLTLGAVVGMVTTWCCIVLANAGAVQVEDKTWDDVGLAMRVNGKG